jgi:hypothetical protein
MSEEKILEEAVKLAEEAKKPGTFSIINVLKERAYPHDEINVYLDENSGYKASKIREKIEELESSIDPADADKVKELFAELDETVKEIELSKYLFTISGISEGLRDDIYEDALKKFPIEYEESKNPFTGEVSKKEIDNKERDRYFTDLLWHSSIKKITDPSGNVQEMISLEDVNQLRELLPLAGIAAITQSIEKLRMSTAVFMASVDEDFLAKS